jgi:hypothetical protein
MIISGVLKTLLILESAQADFDCIAAVSTAEAFLGFVGFPAFNPTSGYYI